MYVDRTRCGSIARYDSVRASQCLKKAEISLIFFGVVVFGVFSPPVAVGLEPWMEQRHNIGEFHIVGCRRRYPLDVFCASRF